MTPKRTFTYSEAKAIAIRILDKAKKSKNYSMKQFCVDHDIPYQSMLAIRSEDQPIELPKVVEKIIRSEFEVDVIPLTIYAIHAEGESQEKVALLETD